MRCTCCGKCCEETEMELSIRDVERLEVKGYNRENFTVKDDKGVIRLKNINGWCFFYNTANKRCNVYKARPMGCYIYPVVYIVDEGIGVDALCPMCETVSEQELAIKGKILIEILKKMEQNTGIQIFTS